MSSEMKNGVEKKKSRPSAITFSSGSSPFPTDRARLRLVSSTLVKTCSIVA